MTTSTTPLPVAEALATMGVAGARLDAIHACEAGAGNISFAFKEAPGLEEVFPLAEPYTLPAEVPHLAGWTVLVTGSGQRLRDVHLDEGACVAAVTIDEGGTTGTLRSTPRRAWAKPTSEFNSHLAVHDDQIARRPELTQHSVVHAQPPYIVVLSHLAECRTTAAFNRRILRWEPETIIQLPDGVGMLEFMVPGSKELMDASVAGLREHRLVVWAKHGVLGRSDDTPLKVVDLIEYAETGALYDHLNTVSGNRSEGLTAEELQATLDAFGVTSTMV